MSERQQGPYDNTAGRWLALVERRQQNFIELCNTGRWRRYYTHAQFLDEMRKVLRLRNQWAQLAGVPVSEQIDFEQIDLQQDVKQSDRHKQGAGARQVTPSSHSGQRRRPGFWLPWRAVSDALDLTALSPYPRVLFKNMTPRERRCALE